MPWHRLFGLILMDYFTNSPYEVQIELDLSTQQQRLDVILLRVQDTPMEQPLPDGFEDLGRYNLISFKSHKDTLDDWALHELVGHYVSYRKWISPTAARNDLLDRNAFRLFAVTARHPEILFKEITPRKIQDGVYDWHFGKMRLRILVLNELPRNPSNAMLHLFTARPDLVTYGKENYQQHSPTTSTVLQRLWQEYGEEGFGMPYTMEDFKREIKESVLKQLTPEELLKQLTPEERLKGLQPEERLKGLAPEERLKGMTREEIEAYLQRLNQEDTSSGQ